MAKMDDFGKFAVKTTKRFNDGNLYRARRRRGLKTFGAGYFLAEKFWFCKRSKLCP